ncbi:hypothetical protein BN137_4033 [Cronobacter condimenti 1330]|uniref:PapC N-terminal domain-containing protein n=1 Tax=Cronobacter condimenti 1330 TaxID=1073999 RepID=K8A3P5_9ENTR|nr:hypothetical protein BN137_4033 [Cronobacter condimenti 1330]
MKVEAYPALNDTGGCVNLEAIPSAAATLDLNHQALMLTLPQTALVQRRAGMSRRKNLMRASRRFYSTTA